MASRNVTMTGVTRTGPGAASRSTTRAARTAALSSRGIEPWPQVPRTWIRIGVKPFSATWIGYSRRPATVTDTPPLSLIAPAAWSQSGWWTAIDLTPASPPASSSDAEVNRMSRRRPGIGSRAGSSPAARASATSSSITPTSSATRSFMSTAPRP